MLFDCLHNAPSPLLTESFLSLASFAEGEDGE